MLGLWTLRNVFGLTFVARSGILALSRLGSDVPYIEAHSLLTSHCVFCILLNGTIINWKVIVNELWNFFLLHFGLRRIWLQSLRFIKLKRRLNWVISHGMWLALTVLDQRLVKYLQLRAVRRAFQKFIYQCTLLRQFRSHAVQLEAISILLDSIDNNIQLRQALILLAAAPLCRESIGE